jgi:hypothetical protein
MAIRKFRTGQMSYNALTYVGTAGTLFYDEDNGALRISDGVTPGGSLISYPIASSSQIGGVKLGPGVILNGDGQIIIDSEGLDFSFGDLAATTGTYPADYFEPARQDEDYSLLSTINANEDIILASNGTGAVRVVGDFSVRRANGNITSALEEEPIFRVRSDGQVRMLVPAADEAEGAFTIVGGLDGVFQAPVNTGVMLHITGIASSPDPTPSRIYNDAQNSFGAFVTRRYNGTAAAPTAVLDGEEILRFSGTAHNGTLIPGVANQRIVYKALGNQTPSNQGGIIEFLATPLNSTTLSKVATVSSTGIALESGKVLTGNVTGNVSGTAGSVAAANITGTTLASNVVTSSLTSVGTLTNLSVTNTITGSVSGNAGTVTNGVYTTDTGTVTNNMLAGSIANNKLANSTISGIALGSNLAALTIDGYLTGTSYNGSIAATIAVDATTAATANKVVARDASGDIFARIVSDSLGNIRSIPINNKVAGYILAATDNGQMISITTGGVTINTGVFASPFGQSISIYNNSASSQTITQGAGVTLRLAGTAATGNRTLARYGVATIVCVASETFVISGAGLV